MAEQITNDRDVIDSREVIERIEELESDIESELEKDAEERDVDTLAEMRTELEALRKLAEEAEGYASDWRYGEALIRASYFTAYIEELISDCYEMPKEMNSGDWPWRHMTVDYEAAADEAKQDYTEVDFDGVSYFIR